MRAARSLRIVLVETMWLSARSEIVVQRLVSICFKIAHWRISCALRPIGRTPLSWQLRFRRHEYQKNKVLFSCVPYSVRFPRTGNNSLAGLQLTLFPSDMERSRSPHHYVDL